MATDAASFAKQLREDGIEAAKAEAEVILTEARKEAEKIVNCAKAAAAKAKEEAEASIAQQKTREEEEMRLVARDLTKAFKKKLEEIGCGLLKAKLASALNEKEVIKTAVIELIKNNQSKDWELSLGKNSASALAEAAVSLFKEKGAKVKIAQALAKAGFELKNAESNEVFELTDESVIESYKNLLSAELKKYLEG